MTSHSVLSFTTIASLTKPNVKYTTKLKHYKHMLYDTLQKLLNMNKYNTSSVSFEILKLFKGF
jgi:hypothetical protein